MMMIAQSSRPLAMRGKHFNRQGKGHKMEVGKIKEKHLSRVAYVYIRQSSQYQVEHNLESQSRQYQLVDKAKKMGFRDVRIIDEDLGLSADGCTERSGFKRLVAEVGLNKVGIILGLEISRFARNNRDLYHLIDLCALFDTLLADQDGVYHPGHPNDRMLLGLKGTISEVEINIMKGRMLEGARNKAKRGELIYRLPIGHVKTEDKKIEKDPDKRIQKAVEQAFYKFRESQSVSQTFQWFVQEKFRFPSAVYGRFGREVIWKIPGYNTIWHVLKNPTYAGAYAYGMREERKCLVDDKIKKIKIQLKMEDWKVLIKNHHPGYIGWEEYEKNQSIMHENHKKVVGSRGPVLGGNSLLSGLLRCRRCGRKLSVSYGGKSGKVPQYSCCSARIHKGGKDCIMFGGMRVDEAVGIEVLKIVEPLAIEASIKTIEEFNKEIDERKKLLILELESAEYETQRAYRQYNKVDPENRLVVAGLESKWNNWLEEVERIKKKLERVSQIVQPLDKQERQKLHYLSEDLAILWNSPSSTNEMRKKVIRTVIEEIIADIDRNRFLVLLDIHWVGGIHTHLEVKKNKTGEHSNCTDKSIVDLVRQLAKRLQDKAIAPLLNRLKLKTGAGNNWTRDRVKVLRNYHKIPANNGKKEPDEITLQEASEKLGISAQSVRNLIKRELISANQIVACAPWSIPVQELEKKEVKNAVEEIKKGINRKKKSSWCKRQINIFQ